jgi:PAS domain S-box-containing protein
MISQTREAPCLPPALWQAMASANAAPVILISAQSGNIVYANRMGQFLVGDDATRPACPAEQVLPCPIAAAIERVRRDGRPFQQHGLALAEEPDHTNARFWDIAYTPLPAETRAASAILITAHDVTYHVLATQAALATNETRLRTILQQIPAAIFIIESADGPMTFQNNRLGQVLASSTIGMRGAGELPGLALHEDGTPYRPEEYPIRRAFSEGATIEAEPMIFRRPDGTIIQLEMHASPVRGSDGKIVAAVGVLRDVTERKRQDEALRESEARLRVAIEAGGLATWEIDLVQGRMQIDAAYAQMLGLPPETFDGSRDDGRALLHPDDLPGARRDLEAAIVAKGPFNNEYRCITLDGCIIWLACHGRVILDAAGNPQRVAGVVREVTARRNREEALREALAARELLLREADHRIKNSLHLICSILALQRTRLDTPDLRAVLDDAISRVLAVAEAHRALHRSTDLRTVDCATMLNDLCRHAAALSPAITFTRDCPTPIALDTERAIPLGLMVSELLTNAAKYAYGAEGGPVLLSAASAGGLITIAVADRGCGIPTDAASGPGLGSRIIASMANQIGATVETASSAGGTVVTLTFAQQEDKA